MKVALATQDMTHVNAHFNGARCMAIYDVSRDGYRLVEALRFDEVSAEDGRHSDEGEDRIRAKVEALSGVALLFVKAIGGPAAARVVQARIHPMKVPDDEAIVSVLDRVQTMLCGSPPPWLRKILHADGAGEDSDRRLAFLDDDEDEDNATPTGPEGRR